MIKGNTRLTRPGYGSHAQVQKCLTEVIQFPTSVTADKECNKCSNLIKANFTGCKMCGSMFGDCRKLIEVNLTNATLSGDVKGFLHNAMSLQNVDFSTTTFENLTDISNFFTSCEKLKTLDLSRMSTSKVRKMTAFCSYCKSLTSLDLSHFDISNVTDLSYMFAYSGLESVNINGWNFQNVTKVDSMFASSHIQTIDTSTWLNANKITNFTNFCNNATTEYITLTFSGSMRSLMQDCKNVKHVTWKNCTVTIDDYSFPCYSATKIAEWQITFDNAIISAANGTVGNLQIFNHLTVESLMSIINALADRTGMDSNTLSLGSAHLAKLTPEQIKIAIDKNWTVV